MCPEKEERPVSRRQNPRAAGSRAGVLNLIDRHLTRATGSDQVLKRYLILIAVGGVLTLAVAATAFLLGQVMGGSWQAAIGIGGPATVGTAGWVAKVIGKRKRDGL